MGDGRVMTWNQACGARGARRGSAAAQPSSPLSRTIARSLAAVQRPFIGDAGYRVQRSEQVCVYARGGQARETIKGRGGGSAERVVRGEANVRLGLIGR